MAKISLPRVAPALTTMGVVLIPVAVGINLVGHFLCQALRLPIFLDVLGTILAGILGGIWAGALTGLITNIVEAMIISPTWLPYFIVNVLCGVAAAFLAKAGWFRDIPRTIVSGIVIALVAIISSAPITAYVYGGVVGAGSDAITAYFLATGQELMTSVLGSTIIVEPADKIISCLVCYFIVINLPTRTREQFYRS